MDQVYIGIDVGGTKLAYGLFDASHHCIASSREKSRPDLPALEMVDMMIGHMEELLKNAGISRNALAGVGAGFPSHFDAGKGWIIVTSNLPNWRNLPIRDILTQRLGVPVSVDNDANAAALAEHQLGAGRGHEHMIYITISTGIGSGLIINRRLFRGSHGMAGEFGHMLVSDSRGVLCGCGNTGCVESICSGPSIVKYLERRIESGVKTSILDIAAGEPITTRHLAKAIELGDALGVEVMTHVSRYLARLFASLYRALDIDCVVYGGGAMKIWPGLMEAVMAHFEELVDYAKEYPVTYLPAELGDDVGVIGAYLLAREGEEER